MPPDKLRGRLDGAESGRVRCRTELVRHEFICRAMRRSITATDTPLGTIARSNPLGAGLSYDATANVTLPSCISGNYYLFVFTDSRRQIFEYDPTFEAEANNYSRGATNQRLRVRQVICA